MKPSQIIPYQMILERYWEGIQRFYMTQSSVIYTMDAYTYRLPLAGYGKAGLYFEKWFSHNA